MTRFHKIANISWSNWHSKHKVTNTSMKIWGYCISLHGSRDVIAGKCCWCEQQTCGCGLTSCDVPPPLITFDVWVCLCHWGVKVWRIRTKSKAYPVSQEQREELRCQWQRDVGASVDQRTPTESRAGGTERRQRPVVCSHQVGRTGSIWPERREENSHRSGAGQCHHKSLYSGRTSALILTFRTVSVIHHLHQVWIIRSVLLIWR